MGLINLVYDPGLGVEYVLISGLISSSITYLLLQLTVRDFKLGFNSSLWKNMLIYALPLLFAGFAGTVNEFLDRSILKHFLPLSEVGIYGACYKLSMFMTLFVQAYRFGAEPFFFKQASEENAKRTYATLMKFFVIVCCFIFLVVTLYLDLFKYFIGEDYHDGLIVVPILLLANLFLGIYYNLSVWYKVTNNTNWGAGIAILGAVITIGLNLLLIPLIGYVGSAIATAVVYIVMVVIAYLAGNKYYPVNYPLGRIFFYLLLSIGLYMTQLYLIEITGLSFWITGSALLLTFCSAAYLLERGQKILD
ncbi:MAG: polysaccharide biosynthesis C-terminal domain-containing protein [Bacteroidetes bacterium]|nr:polysaccharide biosynthesis C-terminal domain-containing protein [Bacteroidota bacterium]